MLMYSKRSYKYCCLNETTFYLQYEQGCSRLKVVETYVGVSLKKNHKNLVFLRIDPFQHFIKLGIIRHF